jgi:hypothetical protein
VATLLPLATALAALAVAPMPSGAQAHGRAGGRPPHVLGEVTAQHADPPR